MTYSRGEAIRASFLSTSQEYIMSGTATAAVVDSRSEPVTRTETTPYLVVTGQGLWDVFMVANEGDKTRMGYVRSLVDTADALQIKGAVDSLIERAVKIDYPEGKPKKAPRGNKEQQARNVGSTIKSAWGAMKFARDSLNSQGYSDETGWNVMRVMAPAALKSVGKTWDGINVPTEADREQAALTRQRKAETDAFIEATKENPRALNESFEGWQARVSIAARAKVEEARNEAVSKAADSVFDALVAKHDRDVLGLLVSKLTAFLASENDGQSDMSEEEANALLAQAVESGEVEVTEE